MKHTYIYLFIWVLLLGFLNTLQAQFQRKLPGVFNQAVYRKADGKIYAIGFNPEIDPTKQFLARIDPRAAVVEKIADLPNTYVAIALSINENYLYLGTDSIQRFNLALNRIDQRFAPQFSSPEKHRCHKLVSIPDQEEILVAFWGAAFEREVATVYAKGVRYGDVLASPSRSNSVATNGKNLYFYEGSSAYPSILQLHLDASGLKLLANKYAYVLDRVNLIQFDKERLYCSDGAVVQVKDAETLTLIGRLDTRASYMALAPDGQQDTIYVQSVRGKEVWLQKFHRTNFQVLAEELLSIINTEQTIDEILPLGTPREFAVVASGQLYLVNRCSPQYPQAPAVGKSVYPACYGDTLRISAAGNFAAERYFWSNGFRGKTFVYPVLNSNYLKLTYRVADEQGCLSAESTPIEINYVHSIPPPPQIQSRYDQAVICAGGALELSIVEADPRLERFQRYLWSDGQTGRSIIVKKAGNYTCRIQTKEGCYTGFSSMFRVQTVAVPQPLKPVLSIQGDNGDLMICSGDGAKIGTTEGYDLYLWSDAYQGKEHQRTLPLEVESMTVRVKNSSGCISEASDVLKWSYATTPERPFIQRSANLLASSSAEGNQWFLNGEAIPGANQQYLKIVEKGTYTVQVVKTTACPSLLSDPLIVN